MEGDARLRAARGAQERTRQQQREQQVAQEAQLREAQALGDLAATRRLQAAARHRAPARAPGRIAGEDNALPPSAGLDPTSAWEQYIAHGTDSLLQTAILATEWRGGREIAS